MPPILVDAKTLSERLGVSYQSLLTWTRRGKVPHLRNGRGQIYYNVDAVLDALRAPAVAPETEGAAK